MAECHTSRPFLTKGVAGPLSPGALFPARSVAQVPAREPDPIERLPSHSLGNPGHPTQLPGGGRSGRDGPTFTDPPRPSRSHPAAPPCRPGAGRSGEAAPAIGRRAVTGAEPPRPTAI